MLDLTRPQAEMFTLGCRFPLFVGGFGSGKTTAMMACAFDDMFSHPGANIGIYAPTYDLIDLIFLPRAIEWLDAMPVHYTYNAVRHMLTVWGYGKFIMRSLERPERIVGYEVFRSHVDELDILPKKKAETAWNKVIARNRQTVNGVTSNMVSSYTTPEGFGFSYQRWESEPGEHYKYVRAATSTNPYIPRSYQGSLEDTYDSQLLEAYSRGYWVNLTSGAIFKHFDRKLNGTDAVAQEHETLHIGQDFNVGIMAGSVHVERPLPDGETGVYAVDELKGCLDTPELIDAVKDRFDNGKRQIIFYPDATNDHRNTTDATRTDIKLIRAAGFKVRVKSQQPPVKSRITSTNARIRNGKGLRRYFVNTKRCKTLTEAFEQHVFNDAGQPDKTEGHDHWTESAGYYLHNRFPVTKPESAALAEASAVIHAY